MPVGNIPGATAAQNADLNNLQDMQAARAGDAQAITGGASSSNPAKDPAQQKAGDQYIAQVAKSATADKGIYGGAISKSPETEKTLKLEQTILKSSGSKEDATAQIDSALKNGAMPKGMRDSLESFKGVVAGDHFNLNDSQKNALATLKGNPFPGPLTPENIQKQIDNKQTSPELRQALERVRDDPALAMALDTADKRNGGGAKADRNISQGDIDQLALQQKLPTP